MSFDVVFFAAQVWTSWIAYPILGLTLLAIVGLAIAYVVKVISPRYPKR